MLTRAGSADRPGPARHSAPRGTTHALGLSFQPTKGGPFSDYARFVGDAHQRDTIWITLRLALPTALSNVLASVPIAYRMRGRFRGKRLITITSAG